MFLSSAMSKVNIEGISPILVIFLFSIRAVFPRLSDFAAQRLSKYQSHLNHIANRARVYLLPSCFARILLKHMHAHKCMIYFKINWNEIVFLVFPFFLDLRMKMCWIVECNYKFVFNILFWFIYVIFKNVLKENHHHSHLGYFFPCKYNKSEN